MRLNNQISRSALAVFSCFSLVLDFISTCMWRFHSLFPHKRRHIGEEGTWWQKGTHSYKRHIMDQDVENNTLLQHTHTHTSSLVFDDPASQ